MKTKGLFLSAIVTGALIFTSCEKKEEQMEVPSDIEAIVQDDADMEDIIDIISDQVDAVTSLDIEGSYPDASEAYLKSAMSDSVEYPIVTKEHFEEGKFYPIKITIDYGPVNHKILVRRVNEAWVRGKIIIVKTGPHRRARSMRTVTFENYYFNDNSVEGTKVYENLSKNDASNFVYSWTVEMKVTSPEERWITKVENKTCEKIAGADTKNIWDDEFLVRGSSSGAKSNGFTYNRHILDENPVWRKRICRFPVKGTVSIVNSKRTFTLDYGDGKCDAVATITDSEGNTKEITFRTTDPYYHL